MQPNCEPAEPPQIRFDRGELWDRLDARKDDRGRCLNEGCRTYRYIEDRVDPMVTWGLKNEATVREVCTNEESNDDRD